MAITKPCGNCGTVFNPELKKCSTCKKVSYCNRYCQKSHWKEHKIDCHSMAIPVTETKRRIPLDVNLIPQEIWISIFKYLSNTDIFRVSLVCKHFKTLSIEAIHTIKLNVDYPTRIYHEWLPRFNAVNAIAKFRFLEKIQITNGKEMEIHGSNYWENKENFDIGLLQVPEHLGIEDFEALNPGHRIEERLLPLDDPARCFSDKILDLDDENDGFYPGFFLAVAINYCPNLKHIELRGVNFICQDFVSVFDEDILQRIQGIINGNDKPMNPNSMFLIAIAYKCVNLESLLIEDLDCLSLEAMSILLFERSSTLKALRICGKNMSDDKLIGLPYCQKLEKFELTWAHNITPVGLKAISKLHNLKSLEISWAYAIQGPENVDSGVRPKHFYNLFANNNMPQLESLCLDCSDAYFYTENNYQDVIDLFNALAQNCKELKHMSLYRGSRRGYHLPQSCIEVLIKNLPNLSHLFIRRCETDIKLAFLQNIIKESPSSCLKINHLEGIITLKNGTTEFKKHPNDQVDPSRHLYGMNPN